MYAWVAIAAAVGLCVAIVLRLAAPPRETAGIDCTPGEPATLTLVAAPSSTLRVWGTYDVDGDADPEEGEVRVTYEARSGRRVVAAGAVDPVGGALRSPQALGALGLHGGHRDRARHRGRALRSARDGDRGDPRGGRALVRLALKVSDVVEQVGVEGELGAQRQGAEQFEVFALDARVAVGRGEHDATRETRLPARPTRRAVRARRAGRGSRRRRRSIPSPRQRSARP